MGFDSFTQFQDIMKFDKPWQARKAYAKMKNSKPLFKGRCRFCENYSEELYPIVIDLCEKCAKNLPDLQAKLVQIKRYHLHPGQCMKCNGLRAKIYQFNVDICIRCMGRWDKSGRRQHTV